MAEGKLDAALVDSKRASQYLEDGLEHQPLADESLGEVSEFRASRHVQNMLQDGNASTILKKHFCEMIEIGYEFSK